MPLLVVGGVLLGSANPSLDATRVDIVPSRLLGRAEAIRTALRDGADASAPLMFGVLAGSIGLRHTFMAMTVSLLIALVLCVVSLRTYARDIRNLESGNRLVQIRCNHQSGWTAEVRAVH